MQYLDINREDVKKIDVDKSTIEKYLSGTGIGIKILYEINGTSASTAFQL